jgi:HK97 family phage portal protein
MSLADTIKRTGRQIAKAISGYPAEGEYRPGPWYLPVTHGWLPADVGNSINWWQNGYTPLLMSADLAIIEACISAYSQTVAMCPGDHWRAKNNGGRERVTTSALSRILRYPNDYQSMSDFLLNAVRQLYLQGNAYALCLRNARYEITELHLMDNRYCRALIDGEGEVHYNLGGNWIVQNRFGPIASVPQRDVLHFKLHCDQLRNPLLGQTPLMAAYLDTLTEQSIKQQQFVFYQRQAKPGYVLSTDLLLNKDQVSALRDRWTEQTTGANVGGTPILTGGLKPQQIPVTNWRDSQLAELLKLSDQDIAMAFRVPPQVVGIPVPHMTHGGTEAIMQSWVASGLGFCLNHIEETIGLTFGLKGVPDEYVEFSTDALLRSAFKDRIEGLARAVQGGIFSPNEARNKEDLPNVEFGDEPRVQAQVVPLSTAGQIEAPANPRPAPSAPAAPAAAPQGRSLDARRTAYARVLLNRSKQLDREQRRRIS